MAGGAAAGQGAEMVLVGRHGAALDRGRHVWGGVRAADVVHAGGHLAGAGVVEDGRARGTLSGGAAGVPGGQPAGAAAGPGLDGGHAGQRGGAQRRAARASGARRAAASGRVGAVGGVHPVAGAGAGHMEPDEQAVRGGVPDLVVPGAVQPRQRDRGDRLFGDPPGGGGERVAGVVRGGGGGATGAGSGGAEAAVDGVGGEGRGGRPYACPYGGGRGNSRVFLIIPIYNIIVGDSLQSMQSWTRRTSLPIQLHKIFSTDF